MTTATSPAPRPLLGLLALANLLDLAAVAAVTLGPRGLVVGARDAIAGWLNAAAAPFAVTLDRADVEYLGNIALFVPVAALLALTVRRGSWLLGAGGGILLSVLIELVQTQLPGRVSDRDDIVANAIGAVIGATLAVAARSVVPRRAAVR